MYLKYFYFTHPSQIFLTGVCKMLDQLALFRCEKLRTMRQQLSRDRKNLMSDFWTIPKNWFIHQLNTYPASRPPPTEEVTRSLLDFTQTRFFMILISDIFRSCFVYCHCCDGSVDWLLAKCLCGSWRANEGAGAGQRDNIRDNIRAWRHKQRSTSMSPVYLYLFSVIGKLTLYHMSSWALTL